MQKFTLDYLSFIPLIYNNFILTNELDDEVLLQESNLFFSSDEIKVIKECAQSISKSSYYTQYQLNSLSFISFIHKLSNENSSILNLWEQSSIERDSSLDFYTAQKFKQFINFILSKRYDAYQHTLNLNTFDFDHILASPTKPLLLTLDDINLMDSHFLTIMNAIYSNEHNFKRIPAFSYDAYLSPSFDNFKLTSTHIHLFFDHFFQPSFNKVFDDLSFYFSQPFSQQPHFNKNSEKSFLHIQAFLHNHGHTKTKELLQQELQFHLFSFFYNKNIPHTIKLFSHFQPTIPYSTYMVNKQKETASDLPADLSYLTFKETASYTMLEIYKKVYNPIKSFRL